MSKSPLISFGPKESVLVTRILLCKGLTLIWYRTPLSLLQARRSPSRHPRPLSPDPHFHTVDKVTLVPVEGDTEAPGGPGGGHYHCHFIRVSRGRCVTLSGGRLPTHRPSWSAATPGSKRSWCFSERRWRTGRNMVACPRRRARWSVRSYCVSLQYRTCLCTRAPRCYTCPPRPTLRLYRNVSVGACYSGLIDTPVLCDKDVFSCDLLPIPGRHIPESLLLFLTTPVPSTPYRPLVHRGLTRHPGVS